MNRIAYAVMACLVASSVAQAADWGSIKGQIVLKGDVPEPVLEFKKGGAPKDAAVCSATDMYKTDLLVDPESKGIANVFVYLYKAPKSVHPDLANPEPKVIFDQENCVFEPLALFVQAGQTVEVLNSDPVAHNTHTYPLRNQAVNILIAPNTPKGEGVDVATSTRESVPIQVKCDFHPWMLAHWLILDHPYGAVTDKSGNFEIKNLPAGDHEFRLWHEKVGYLDRKFKVTVKAGETTELKKAEYEVK